MIVDQVCLQKWLCAVSNPTNRVSFEYVAPHALFFKSIQDIVSSSVFFMG